MNHLFEEFSPRDDLSLVTSWEIHLANEGFRSQPATAFWDSVSQHPTLPIVKARTHRGPLTALLVRRITLDSAPVKVIFVERGAKIAAQYVLNAPAMAANRCAVYYRSAGWLATPSQAWREVIPELHPLVFVKAWRFDSDGVWRKACRKCKERKPVEDFYRISRMGVPHGRDPYGQWCRDCEREKHRRRAAARKR
jgi:hypothetical protein